MAQLTLQQRCNESRIDTCWSDLRHPGCTTLAGPGDCGYRALTMNTVSAPSSPPDGAGDLAALAEFGEYFALPVATADGQWRPLPELFDEPMLSEHVRRTRAAMAGHAGCALTRVPIRVAASSFQLGVAARLLSPVIAAALCFDAVPRLDNASLRWQLSANHAPRFAVVPPQWSIAPTPPAAARLIADSVVGVLTDLGAHLHTLTSLSAQITRGNITSAANGAVTVLALSRPQCDAAGRMLVRALLDTEALTGTGAFVDGRFRRRSCCLYYRAPRSGLCGDCVLTAAPASAPGDES